MNVTFMRFVIGGLIGVASSLTRFDDFRITYRDIRQGALPQLADAIQRRVKSLRFNVSCCPGDKRVEGIRYQIKLHNPGTNGLDVRRGSRNSSSGFGRSTFHIL